MSYHVEYGKERFMPNESGMRPGRILAMALGAAALFLMGAYRYSPEAGEILKMLFPVGGTPGIRSALETMVLELRGGTALGEAVTAFCRDVIQIGMEFAA